MILFCIGAGYIGYCVADSFYFVTIKNGKTKKNHCCVRSVVNSGEGEV